MYTPSDWYWFIGSDDTQVWSSKRYNLVPVGDAEYAAWLDLDPGNLPTKVPTMAELEAVLAAQYPAGSLVTYNTDARERRINDGIMVGGVPFATDPITQAELNGAYIFTQSNVGATFQWKLPDGSFVTLDKQAVQDVQGHLTDFKSKCFACEDDTLTEIEGSTITTLAQIDAAYAAVPNSYTMAVQLQPRHQRQAS